ncbi:MAG: hypothetical protein L7U87_08940 [Chlamydiales bacterium]|nr:hypothetical protein [Chlamydiales bacterium]
MRTPSLNFTFPFLKCASIITNDEHSANSNANTSANSALSTYFCVELFRRYFAAASDNLSLRSIKIVPVDASDTAETAISKDISALIRNLFSRFARPCISDEYQEGRLMPLTSCYSTAFVLADILSTPDKVELLSALFAYRDTFSLTNESENSSRCYQLILKDFFSGIVLSSKPFLGDWLKLRSYGRGELESQTKEEFQRLSDKLDSFYKRGYIHSLESILARAKLLSEFNELKLRVINSFAECLKSNKQDLSFDKSFIYYIAIKHFDGGFSHVFCVEQYLNDNSEEAFRFYNSYQNHYTLYEWMERDLHRFNHEQLNEFIDFLKLLFSSVNWNSSIASLWDHFFKVSCSLKHLVAWENVRADSTLSTQQVVDELKTYSIRFLCDSFSPHRVASHLDGLNAAPA